ncbi:MAG: 16S rRNA (uracil(1498)-N(3))-methyltransferase [Bacteroidota bacterium]
MYLFYQSDIINNSICNLSEDESRHCAQVLRLKFGDVIHITNGKGSLYTATLNEVHHKQCVVSVQQEHRQQKSESFRLHMAIAPTKNMDRTEWFVEKAVELGIDEITPIICARSERREIKTDRLKKVAISAMKQSLKNFLPQINEAVPLKKLLEQPIKDQRFICFGDAADEANLAHAKVNEYHNLFLIGPEGDFTAQEITAAIEKGYQPLNLGKSRLRTETAALHVVSIVNFKQAATAN